MPFTLSHAAAALPFRRMRLVPSALVVGTFAPDIEYFIRLRPGGGYGHTILGAFLMSLPLGLVALWLFHRFVKRAAVRLMPPGLECRLIPFIGEFRFFPWARFAMICASMLLGIATHLLWDSFTHRHTWLYNHWEFLHQAVRLTPRYAIHWYSVFQFVSSVLGIAILLIWFVEWYRTHPPNPHQPSRTFSPGLRWGVIALMFAVSMAAGCARARFAIHWHATSTLAIDAMVTFFAALWWQLVIWGAGLGSRADGAVRASPVSAGEPVREQAGR